MSYVYILSAPSVWTVGFYAPDGAWHPEKDCSTPEEAAARVHWLNGGDYDDLRRALLQRHQQEGESR